MSSFQHCRGNRYGVSTYPVRRLYDRSTTVLLFVGRCLPAATRNYVLAWRCSPGGVAGLTHLSAAREPPSRSSVPRSATPFPVACPYSRDDRDAAARIGAHRRAVAAEVKAVFRRWLQFRFSPRVATETLRESTFPSRRLYTSEWIGIGGRTGEFARDRKARIGEQLPHRHLFLQFFEPVEDDVDLRRTGVSALLSTIANRSPVKPPTGTMCGWSKIDGHLAWSSPWWVGGERPR